jgi:hypothetical protein
MRRILYLLASFALFSCAFTPLTARAADINNADAAARLEAIFTKALENQKTVIEAAGGKLTLDSDVAIEKGKNYYAVTLPAITVTDKNDDITRMGLIALNVVPTGTPGEWKMSVALPSPILFEEENGRKITRVDFGKQEMSGIWNEKLENFSKLTAQYDNIKISQNVRRETLTFDQVDIAVDLQETANGKWSGPTRFAVNGMSFGKPDAPRLAYFESAKLGITINDFSPKAQQESLQKISETITAEDESLFFDEDKETVGLLLALFKSSGTSLNMQGVVKNLEINTPTAATLTTRHFFLESGSFLFDITGFHEGMLNQTLKMAYRGLELPQDDRSAFKDILPTLFQTSITVKNIPIADLLKPLSTLVLSDNEENNKVSKQIAAIHAMITLPQIFTRAKTEVTVQETKYGNDIYETRAEGKLKASSKSIIGIVGDITLKTWGLDALIKKLEAKKQAGPTHDPEDIERTLKRLKLLKQISLQEDDEYICHIQLGEKAKITINGAPLGKLK